MKPRTIALLAGPALFLLVALLPAPAGMSETAKIAAAITLWVAVWWIAEPIDLAVTSLLPLVLFPLTGLPMSAISGEYGNELIFLFISGFFFGKTIERWRLHRRIALRLIALFGNDPKRTVLGFMVATAFISMWISNTATAVMMTPVAIAVAQNSKSSHPNFSKNLLLGVGYACSIGGLGTVIGTPTNGIFLAYVQQHMGQNVSFFQWMLFGTPFAALLLLVCWVLLMFMFPIPAAKDSALQDTIRLELRALGPLTTPEKLLLLIFGSVILAWISGSIWWYTPLNEWIHQHFAANPGAKMPRYINDTLIALTGALALFLVPAFDRKPVGDDYNTLLDWKHAVQIPWGIVLFFGGGLALAKGFEQSGLALWMGAQMEGLAILPQALLLFVVLAVVVLLSEIASNVATASMLMPILAALAASVGIHPFGLLISAAMAATFGFGLPIATPPNTIVYSAGFFSTREMARAGFLLDLLAIVLLVGFIYAFMPLVWGFAI